MLKAKAMAALHSDIPQCVNQWARGNEPIRGEVQSHPCHMQMSSPPCTDCVAIQYPSDVTTDSARKNYKQNFLKTTLKYFLLINLKLEDSATSFSSLIIPMSGMKPSLTISPL